MSRYEIDDLTVSATVYPASGFVSVAESDPAVWQQLLSGVGGMDNVAAATLAEQIVNSELERPPPQARGRPAVFSSIRGIGEPGQPFMSSSCWVSRV